ncbi:MAG: magnesium transporter [Acidobacteria bacterium]|nr:magnesium transporter [Acidobacteriota bacterium]MCG3194180.1 Magnesium transporter MgtE [Thermoanaerobaculia bacterium]MCK6685685.1 magnesium transporter [Thermoanaerobaculia bacterium]
MVLKLGTILGPDVLEILRDDPEALGEGLRDFHPADIADLLYEIPREDRLTVLEHLDSDILGQVLTYLGGGVLRLALTRLPHKMLGRALDTLEPDDGARLLSFLPEEKRLPVLANMSARDAAEARGLLAYEPGTAGRLMTGKLVKVRPEWTVAETLEHLKKIDPEVATVADLYAVDDKERLVGVMSLRKLLPAPPARRIGSLMTRDVISVGPDTPDDDVSRLVSKYGFNALPVIGDDRKVLGIVTVDDVVDVLVSKETQAALRMGGVQASEEHKDERSPLDYFGTPIHKIVRTRIGWLLLLFVAATFTGTVLRHFEEELSRVVALSFFIPLIIGTGGNAGSQTVSTIIRALALGEVKLKDTLRVLFRESSTGLMLGLLLCAAAVLRALLWHTGWHLALVVGLTILAVCAWSNIVAAMVPLLAQKLKIDPTVVSAPMITTVVDGTGLAIYMLIAKVILGL